MLLRRERSDDCFKPRITTQRIPKRVKTQMAVAQNAPREIRRLCHSLNCAILIAHPRVDHGQVLDQHRTFDGAFTDGHQLDGTLAFPNGILLISKSSINHTECTESCRIMRLAPHGLLEFLSRTSEGSAGCRFIAAEPGGETPAPTVGKRNIVVVATTAATGHGGQCAFGCSGIALA